ncbi:MAG: hypothetical protein GKR89_13760 [Candidatus Latescibacteria bacterium]|nr:hypothetical protein [Candidatus Latescibacterota bacterium]
MRAEITRHALDRVPLSIIFDDSTVLVNLNYFMMRDYNIEAPGNPALNAGQDHRWQDVPVVHPESFTREFAEFCLEKGVRGKFSVVPCPAGLGRIDEYLPLFSRTQQDSWLEMCRELIVPAFDITPEMLTHTHVLDLDTFQPRPERIWEQYEWRQLPADDEEGVVQYIAKSCEILVNVGLTPQGVTSPGGFGRGSLDLYARCAGQAVRQVTGNPLPYFFQGVETEGRVDSRVWYADPQSGTAVGEVIAGAHDWTGNWTGYGEAEADLYITADLQGGRLPQLIAAGDPAIMVSHWQGFYGLHDDDRRGFKAFQTVVDRLRQLDPRGERTQWRRCSEISTYACAREMAQIEVADNQVTLDLPVMPPELTLRLHIPTVDAVRIDGQPLRRVGSRAHLQAGAFLQTDNAVLVAFDPQQSHVKIEVER